MKPSARQTDANLDEFLRGDAAVTNTPEAALLGLRQAANEKVDALETLTVAKMIDAVAGTTQPTPISWRSNMKYNFSRARVAAAAFVLALFGSTGLAYGNALPGPLQHVASVSLNKVGLHVEDPDDHHDAENETEANDGVNHEANHEANDDANHDVNDDNGGANETEPGRNRGPGNGSTSDDNSGSGSTSSGGNTSTDDGGSGSSGSGGGDDDSGSGSGHSGSGSSGGGSDDGSGHN